MDKLAAIASEIVDRVSMPDAVRMYMPGVTPLHHRVPCPIHGGKGYNLDYTDRLYHCFVCGDGGDVITFVRHVFGLPFPAALDKLNEDFRLGLPIGRKMTLLDRRTMSEHLRQAAAARAERDAADAARAALYDELWSGWIAADKIYRTLSPQTPDQLDNADPRWIEACKLMGYYGYRIDTEL